MKTNLRNCITLNKDVNDALLKHTLDYSDLVEILTDETDYAGTIDAFHDFIGELHTDINAYARSLHAEIIKDGYAIHNLYNLMEEARTLRVGMEYSTNVVINGIVYTMDYHRTLWCNKREHFDTLRDLEELLLSEYDGSMPREEYDDARHEWASELLSILAHVFNGNGGNMETEKERFEFWTA